MSHLPVKFDQSSTPVLNDALIEALRISNKQDFAGFGGGFRSIKVRKMDFLLKDGAAQEVIPPYELYGVFLASVPYNHCVWYEKSYQPGQEPELPDLLWKQTDDGKQYPDSLPIQFREKIQVNGQYRWAFQVRRRTVWALVRNSGNGSMYIDLETPYVFDISSMSLFGKGQPEANAYKWSGIYNLCQQQSNNTFICTPSMFLTQILIDPNVQVPGVVFFRPNRNSQNGGLQFLDAELIEKIHQVRMQDSVQSLLDVKEILNYKPNENLEQSWDAPMPPMNSYSINYPTQPTAKPVVPNVVSPVTDPTVSTVSPVAPKEPPAQTIQGDKTPASLLAKAQEILNKPIQNNGDNENDDLPDATSADIDSLLTNL